LEENPEDVGQRAALSSASAINTSDGVVATWRTYKKVDYAHALSRSDTDVQMYVLFLCSWLETQSAGGPRGAVWFLSGWVVGTYIIGQPTIIQQPI